MKVAVPPPLGTVAHYTLLERLDPAGPGELYRARDTRLGRTVTVRLLPDTVVPDQGARAALLDQARTIRSLSHPNIITLFDAGEHEGRCYLVFEFLKGRSLRAEMGGRVMNVRRAVEIATHVADAVADAHAAGFGHGGLSPETVVITARGQSKVPAFELATREGFDPARGGLHLVDYQSPEEARGEPPDDRSDVFSVGAILYEMLTGRRPSPKGAAAPRAANPRVPPELDRVVLAAIAPNAASRCPGAAQLAADLRRVTAALDAHEADGRAEPHETRIAGLPRGLFLVAAGVIVLVLVLWMWFA
jgi:serine/threonine protein kinase